MTAAAAWAAGPRVRGSCEKGKASRMTAASQALSAHRCPPPPVPPPRSSRAARRRRAATLTAAIPTAHKPTAANPAAFA